MVMVTDGSFFPISPDPLKIGISYSVKSWQSHGDSDWLYFFPNFSQSILSWNWLQYEVLAVSHKVMTDCTFSPWSTLSWNQLQYEVLAVNHMVMMTDCAMQDVAP